MIKHWCTKCANLLSCHLRPGLIHELNTSLGFITATGCTVALASASELIASCLECGAPAHIPRFSAPGTHDCSCHRCHARLALSCKEWEVEVRQGGRAPEVPPASLKMGLPKYPVGRPLPNQGACGHYRQSFRWLRFPCCGLAFPCPECHDENSPTHPWERAKRMLCGHCSREQPFSNNPCVACGADLRKGIARTAHWEGGQGQRDRSLMAGTEKRKYAGLAKTLSAKNTRVGSEKDKAAARAALGRE